MFRNSKPLVRVLLVALVLPLLCAAQNKEKERNEKQAGPLRLRIEVTAGEKNQPVENASVYIKYLQERALRKDKMIEMNFKTNREGVVKVPDAPRRRVLIQVIAEGWKTFGEWYDIETDEQTIKIHLKKPPRWY